MRWSWSGDEAEARRLTGQARQALGRIRAWLKPLGIQSGVYRHRLTDNAYALLTIHPWIDGVHIVVQPTTVGGGERADKYFEFASSGHPVVTEPWVQGLLSGDSYSGCVVRCALTIEDGALVAAPTIQTGVRIPTMEMHDASLVGRHFQVQLIDEPVGFLNPESLDGQTVYKDTVYTTFAPWNPYSGIYASSVNQERPGHTNTEVGTPQAFLERDIGYDVIFSLSQANEQVESAVLNPPVAWPRATGVQDAGGRKFAIYIDDFGKLSVFPVSEIDPLTIYSEQNVDPSFVQTLTIEFPSWAFIPPDTGENQYNDGGQNIGPWLRNSPDFRWSLNHLGTKACCVLHEREAIVQDTAYLTDPDTNQAPGAVISTYVGSTGTQSKFNQGTDAAITTLYSYGRGVFEVSIAIEITGPDPQNFATSLTYNVVRNPRDSDRGTFMVGYAWHDSVDAGIAAGDMLLLDIERWYQHDEAEPASELEWTVSWVNSRDAEFWPVFADPPPVELVTMTGEELADWLDESGRGPNWAGTVAAQVSALNSLGAPQSEIDYYSVGTEMPGFYESSGGGANPYQPYDGDAVRAIIDTDYVTGEVTSFFSLRKIRDGAESEVMAITGEALLGCDFRTASFAIAVEHEETVNRTVNAAYGTPGAQAALGWTATADMPHRISHPGVAIYIMGAFERTLTPDGASAEVIAALEAKAELNPRTALDGSWTYMTANDDRDWTDFPMLRDYQMVMNSLATAFSPRLDEPNPLNNLTVAERNWWLAACVNSSNRTLLLASNPKFGWSVYTSEVINRTQNAYTTFFAHPNGSWAYYDNQRLYNTHGVPDLFQQWTAGNVNEPSGRYDGTAYTGARYFFLTTSTLFPFGVSYPHRDLYYNVPYSDLVENWQYDPADPTVDRYEVLTATIGPTEAVGTSQMRKFVSTPAGPVATYPSGESIIFTDVGDPAADFQAPVSVNTWNDYDTLTPIVQSPESIKHQIFDAVHLAHGTYELDTSFRALYNAAVAELPAQGADPLESAALTDLQATMAPSAAQLSSTDGVTNLDLNVEWGGEAAYSVIDGAYRNNFTGLPQAATPGFFAQGAGRLLKLRLRRDGYPPTFSTCLLLDL